MKKILLYAVLFFCLLLAAYKGFFYLDHSAEEKAVVHNESATRLSAAEMEKIEEGDIILRRGFGYFSDIISGNLNKGSIDVTHAGIIIKQNGAFFVIHSLSSDVTNIDGVQIQPLKEFLKYSAPDKIIITRLKNCTPAQGHAIAERAKYYLNMHVPFDPHGNYDDDSEFFCTELIWKILEKDLRYVTLPAEPEARKHFFYSMAPMYDTVYFDIKVNQYNDIKKNTAQRAAF